MSTAAPALNPAEHSLTAAGTSTTSEDPTTQHELVKWIELVAKSLPNDKRAAIFKLQTIAQEQISHGPGEGNNVAFYLRLCKDVIRGERTMNSLTETVHGGVGLPEYVARSYGLPILMTDPPTMTTKRTTTRPWQNLRR